MDVAKPQKESNATLVFRLKQCAKERKQDDEDLKILSHLLGASKHHSDDAQVYINRAYELVIDLIFRRNT